MMMTMSVPIPMYMGRVVPVRPIGHASVRCDQWSATRPKVPRTPGAAKWSSADAVVIDEAHDQLDRMPSLAHVVLDEAQDLSAMQYRAAANVMRAYESRGPRKASPGVRRGATKRRCPRGPAAGLRPCRSG